MSLEASHCRAFWGQSHAPLFSQLPGGKAGKGRTERPALGGGALPRISQITLGRTAARPADPRLAGSADARACPCHSL